jgi:DNA-binding MarR family transcriptional regulator
VLLLDHLENSGHVRRVRNPANRREQFVRLTPKGTAVTRRVLASKTKFYRAVFAPLDDALIRELFKAAQVLLAFEAAGIKATRQSG